MFYSYKMFKKLIRRFTKQTISQTRNKSISVKRRGEGGASKRRKKVILENRNPLPGGTRERRKGRTAKVGRARGFCWRRSGGNRQPRRLLRARMFESGFSKWPQGDSIGIIRNGEARWRDKWPLTGRERKVWRGRPFSRIGIWKRGGPSEDKSFNFFEILSMIEFE